MREKIINRMNFLWELFKYSWEAVLASIPFFLTVFAVGEKHEAYIVGLQQCVVGFIFTVVIFYLGFRMGKKWFGGLNGDNTYGTNR